MDQTRLIITFMAICLTIIMIVLMALDANNRD